MDVNLITYPTEKDWAEVKRRALVTIGKELKTPPTEEWKKEILNARHSPIRWLRFSFDIECPSWVSVHLCRHIHAQPYVKSQRNDRQTDYDRNKAPQDTPVRMIWDMNAEELMVIANKRLCNMASPETRAVVREMCKQVILVCPEFRDFLVPMCEYIHDCREFKGGCGKFLRGKETTIGQRMTVAKMRKGLTFADISKETGLHVNVLSYYFNDKRDVPAKNLSKIAKALGVTTDYLCGVGGYNGN